MMKNKIVTTLLLILSLNINQIYASSPLIITAPYPSHLPTYQLDGPPQFSNYDPKHPYESLFSGSAHKNKKMIHLLQRVKHLRKIGKLIPVLKQVDLSSFLGPSGLELLSLFMNSPQKVVNEFGEVQEINILKGKGASPLIVRDLIHAFVQEFQKTGLRKLRYLRPAKGVLYQKSLDAYVRSLGFTVFSSKTLGAVREFLQKEDPINNERISSHQVEHLLYYHLQKDGVLDRNKKFKKDRNKKITTESIIKNLIALKITDSKLHHLILHDLGFISPDDLDHITELISNHYRDQNLTPHLQLHLKEILSHHINDIDSFTKNIDLAILQSITDKRDVINFCHSKKVSYPNHQSKRNDDLIVLTKLAYLQNKKMNYLDLEDDLGKIKMTILRDLSDAQIENETFDIISSESETLINDSLLFIAGFGVVSVTGFYLLTKLFEQYVPVISSFFNFGLASGNLSGLMGAWTILQNGVQMVGTVKSLINLKLQKKTSDILDDHLRELQTDFSNDTNSARYKSTRVLRFGAVTDHYIKNQEQKLLLHKLKLNGLNIGVGTVAVLIGIHAILAIIGLSFATSTLLGVTIFGQLFFIVAAMVAMKLVSREFSLMEQVEMARDVYQRMSQTLGTRNQELEEKQKKFLDLFFANSKEVLTLCVAFGTLGKAKAELPREKTLGGIDHQLVKMYKARGKAFDALLKIHQKTPEAWTILKDLTNSELKRQKSQLTFEELIRDSEPTSFIGGLDGLFDCIDPSSNRSANLERLEHCPMPRISALQDNYWSDLHLSRLFSITYLFQNNIQSNRQEYRLLLRKQNLLKTYFNQSLSSVDLQKLKKRITKRLHKNEELLRSSNIENEQRCLSEIHADSPFPEKDLLPWDDSLVEEMKELQDQERHLLNEMSEQKMEERVELKTLTIPNTRQQPKGSRIKDVLTLYGF